MTDFLPATKSTRPPFDEDDSTCVRVSTLSENDPIPISQFPMPSSIAYGTSTAPEGNAERNDRNPVIGAPNSVIGPVPTEALVSFTLSA